MKTYRFRVTSLSARFIWRDSTCKQWLCPLKLSLRTGPVIPEIWLQKICREGIRIRHILICRILIRLIIFRGRIFTSAMLQPPVYWRFFVCTGIFSGRARVCWPLVCLCRPFCIFERCLGSSNPESCRSKQARYQLSHPSP